MGERSGGVGEEKRKKKNFGIVNWGSKHKMPLN
jgi:hypothetical protein